MKKNKKKKFSDNITASLIAFALAATVIYFVASFWNLRYPALTDDEIYNVGKAVYEYLVSETDYYIEPTMALERAINIGGLEFRICSAPYKSRLLSYLVFPVFKLFGMTWEVLRASSIFLALLAAVFIFLYTKDIFGRKTGIIFLILILTNSSFIINSRVGAYIDTSLWLLLGLSLFFLAEFIKKDLLLFFYISYFFIWGAGCTHYSYFSITVFFIIFWLYIQNSVKFTAKQKLTAVSFLFAWFILLAIFTIFTFDSVRTHQWASGTSLTNKFDFVAVLQRLKNISVSLTGYNIRDAFHWTNLVVFFPYLLLPIAFIQNHRRKENTHNTHLYFLSLSMLLFILGISILYTGTGANHFVMILPLLILVAAISVRSVIRNPLLLSILLFVMIIINIDNLHRYFKIHINRGSRNFWFHSQSQENLIKYLGMIKCKKPIVLFNEIIMPAIFLTRGELWPIGYDKEFMSIDVFILKAKESGNIVVGVAEDFTAEGYSSNVKDLKQELIKKGYRLKKIYEFKNFNDEIMYIVYKLIEL